MKTLQFWKRSARLEPCSSEPVASPLAELGGTINSSNPLKYPSVICHASSSTTVPPISTSTDRFDGDNIEGLQGSHSHEEIIPSFMKQELEQAFKVFDANGDGKISAEELRQVLRSLGDNTTQEEAIRMLKEVDANDAGYIDLDQFIKLHMLGLDSAGQLASSDELKDTFRVFDLDKNGYITPEELKHVLMNLVNREYTLDECCSMIQGVDLDGDGRVNFEEFTLMMA